MRIAVAGSAIVCSRVDNTLEDDNTYRHVVEFDAHVDSVPEHVTDRLTSGEILQLEEFLADRRRMPVNTDDHNLLEVLPGSLREAIAIIESMDETSEAMHSAMYEELSRTTADLALALEKVKPLP